MNSMGKMIGMGVAAVLVAAMARNSVARDVRLTDKGEARCVIVVSPDTMTWEGDDLDMFSGYCKPATFDVTDSVTAGVNQITIVCERKWLNELGTGGLMGPVVVFREK